VCGFDRRGFQQVLISSETTVLSQPTGQCRYGNAIHLYTTAHYDAIHTERFLGYDDTLCIQVSFFLRRTSTYFYRVTLCGRVIYYGPLFVCLSVCVCVCLLQVGIVLKRLDMGSRKRNYTIAQGDLFSGAKDLSEITPLSPAGRDANCRCGSLKSATFGK